MRTPPGRIAHAALAIVLSVTADPTAGAGAPPTHTTVHVEASDEAVLNVRRVGRYPLGQDRATLLLFAQGAIEHPTAPAPAANRTDPWLLTPGCSLGPLTAGPLTPSGAYGRFLSPPARTPSLFRYAASTEAGLSTELPPGTLQGAVVNAAPFGGRFALAGGVLARPGEHVTGFGWGNVGLREPAAGIHFLFGHSTRTIVGAENVVAGLPTPEAETGVIENSWRLSLGDRIPATRLYYLCGISSGADGTRRPGGWNHVLEGTVVGGYIGGAPWNLETSLWRNGPNAQLMGAIQASSPSFRYPDGDRVESLGRVWVSWEQNPGSTRRTSIVNGGPPFGTEPSGARRLGALSGGPPPITAKSDFERGAAPDGRPYPGAAPLSGTWRAATLSRGPPPIAAPSDVEMTASPVGGPPPPAAPASGTWRLEAYCGVDSESAAALDGNCKGIKVSGLRIEEPRVGVSWTAQRRRAVFRALWDEVTVEVGAEWPLEGPRRPTARHQARPGAAQVRRLIVAPAVAYQVDRDRMSCSSAATLMVDREAIEWSAGCVIEQGWGVGAGVAGIPWVRETGRARFGLKASIQYAPPGRRWSIRGSLERPAANTGPDWWDGIRGTVTIRVSGGRPESRS